MKLHGAESTADAFCRTSHEVRGLKSAGVVQTPLDLRRTSHEVRGLKYLDPKDTPGSIKSHLTRGAWIEI